MRQHDGEASTIPLLTRPRATGDRSVCVLYGRKKHRRIIFLRPAALISRYYCNCLLISSLAQLFYLNANRSMRGYPHQLDEEIGRWCRKLSFRKWKSSFIVGGRTTGTHTDRLIKDGINQFMRLILEWVDLYIQIYTNTNIYIYIFVSPKASWWSVFTDPITTAFNSRVLAWTD